MDSLFHVCVKTDGAWIALAKGYTDTFSRSEAIARPIGRCWVRGVSPALLRPPVACWRCSGRPSPAGAAPAACRLLALLRPPVACWRCSGRLSPAGATLSPTLQPIASPAPDHAPSRRGRGFAENLARSEISVGGRGGGSPKTSPVPKNSGFRPDAYCSHPRSTSSARICSTRRCVMLVAAATRSAVQPTANHSAICRSRRKRSSS